MFLSFILYFSGSWQTEKIESDIDQLKINFEDRMQGIENKVNEIMNSITKVLENSVPAKSTEDGGNNRTESSLWLPADADDYKKIRMMARHPSIDPVKVYELLLSIVDKHPGWSPGTPNDLRSVEMPEDLHLLLSRIDASAREFWSASWAAHPKLKHLLGVDFSAKMNLDVFQNILVCLMSPYFGRESDAQLAVKEALDGSNRQGLLNVIGHILKVQLESELPPSQRFTPSNGLGFVSGFNIGGGLNYSGGIGGGFVNPLLGGTTGFSSPLDFFTTGTDGQRGIAFHDSDITHAARLAQLISFLPVDNDKIKKAVEILQAVASTARIASVSEYLFFVDTKDQVISAKAEKGGILFNFLYNFRKFGWDLDVAQATTAQHNSTEFSERMRTLPEVLRTNPIVSTVFPNMSDQNFSRAYQPAIGYGLGPNRGLTAPKTNLRNESSAPSFAQRSVNGANNDLKTLTATLDDGTKVVGTVSASDGSIKLQPGTVYTLVQPKSTTTRVQTNQGENDASNGYGRRYGKM